MNRTLKFLLPFLIFAVTSLRGGFLVDENPEPAKVNPADSGTVAQSVGFPADTALNIAVTPIDGIPNSVRISWDVSAGSDDTFIVGRAVSMPDNPKTALEALSIRIVPSGANKAIVDRNIPSGNYYYVILSKKRSASKNIDLYPNENYTTNPIIIGAGTTPAQKSAPPQVKSITTELVGEKSVLVMWKPLDFVGVTYSVYRSYEPMSTPDKLKGAEKIAELYDRDRFVDKNPSSGVCFYAVVTSDSAGIEDTQLTPNESYTTAGINILKTEAVKVVSALKALPNERSGVNLTWKAIPGFDGEYLVYRSRSVINSAQAFASSELAGSVVSTLQEFTDKKSGYGDFYYAVIAKDGAGRKTEEFYDGYNYTRQPVNIEEPQDPVKLKLIKAEAQNGTAVITWKYGGAMQRDYLLYRSDKIPKTSDDVSDAYLVDTIDLTRNSFRDTNIPDGSYYYILVPENYLEDKSFFLRKGINFTAIPVELRSEFADISLKVRSLSASSGDNVGEVKIFWKVTGTEGSTTYSLLRLSSAPRTKQEIAEGTLVDVIDVNALSYTDKPKDEASYYYALLPEDYLHVEDLKLTKGENVTSSAVIPAQKAVAVVKDEPAVIKPDDVTPKKDVIIPEPDVYVQKPDSAKKSKTEKLEVEDSPVVAGDIDFILKKYFYAKKYNAAIEKFRKVASQSNDPATVAKALFYAGRGYVEKGEYNTALNYFLNKKVRTSLPRQSEFWKDYCIKRMKNK